MIKQQMRLIDADDIQAQEEERKREEWRRSMIEELPDGTHSIIGLRFSEQPREGWVQVSFISAMLVDPDWPSKVDRFIVPGSRGAWINPEDLHDVLTNRGWVDWRPLSWGVRHARQGQMVSARFENSDDYDRVDALIRARKARKRGARSGEPEVSGVSQ